MNEPKTIADVLDKSIDKLSGGAAEIAKAVKQVAPHAWEVAVRQQLVEAYVGMGVFVAGCALLLVLIRVTRRIARSEDSGGRVRGYFGDSEPSAAAPFTLSAGLLAIVLMIRAFWCVPDDVMQALNPEYYAAWEFINAVPR